MTQDIEAIARRLVVGRKRDGRSIYDENAKRDLVQACRQRDVSLAKIARVCGINANVLSNWLRLHERARATTSAPSGDVVDMAASPFVAVQLECAAQEPAATLSMQVRLPNGVVVDMQGCELQQAGRLIEALGRL
jgi:transposase